MDETAMNMDDRGAINKAILALMDFIQRKSHSDCTSTMKIITGTGDVVDIYTAEEAKVFKNHLQNILELERLYSK